MNPWQLKIIDDDELADDLAEALELGETLRAAYPTHQQREARSELVTIGLSHPWLLAGHLTFTEPPRFDLARLRGSLEALEGAEVQAHSDGALEVTLHDVSVVDPEGVVMPSKVLVHPVAFKLEGDDAIRVDPAVARLAVPEVQAVLACRWGLQAVETNPLVRGTDRLRALCRVLQPIARELVPEGLVWKPADAVVPRDAVMDVLSHEHGVRSAFVLRQVRDADEPGVMLFDTVGLRPLWLPEVQLHFRGDVALGAAAVNSLATTILELGAPPDGMPIPLPGLPSTTGRYAWSKREPGQIVFELHASM